MTFEQPRLLLIDSYDSFTYNLASLFRLSIPNCVIYIIKNDDFAIEELQPLLPYFTAIIIGPGPGSPDNPIDIGVVQDIWRLAPNCMLPIFGVCLGLQSLGIEYGARLQRLRVVKHGQVSEIQHLGTNLFRGIGLVAAVRYHSLHIVLQHDGELEELAWADDGKDNGCVVMAIRHKSRPFWAVQYHPESICTVQGGAEVISNFWQLALAWTNETGRAVRLWDALAKRAFGNPWPYSRPCSIHLAPPLVHPSISTTVVDIPYLSVTAVAELLGALDDESPFVLLDSAAKPGRFSIVASLHSTSLQITHYVTNTYITLKQGDSVAHEELTPQTVWSWLATFMRARRFTGHPDIPFWGGLVGQLSYELGVHSLHVPLTTHASADSRHPDVNLVFVERSIVLDSTSSKAYIQSLIPGDDQWISDTLTKLVKASSLPAHSTRYGTIPTPIIELPDKERYISRIKQAKESLFAGDSYELCLTTNTVITIPECSSATLTSWERYKLLRHKNPAPHSAFFRLHPSTFLSSSPERFLSYSRPPHSTCQLRPIKGTVRKAPGITRAIAESLLAGSKKEVAENLMIVDLIRHDLHSVIGENVQVKQFCAVEEYETVWQMVSVVEGRLAEHSSTDIGTQCELGWNVLQHGLPPGSMTGAPKKRSIEILQSLEDEERNLYSGVFGYWCVGGSGDWSVAIRSCTKYQRPHNYDVSSQWTEKWTVGAGGAITALSDPEAEWDEMVVKLQSVLNAFEP